MSRKLFAGEVRQVGMEVTHTEGEAFTISAVTYEIKDTAGTVIDSGTGDSDEGHVFCLVDTALLTVGQTYRVWFTVTITGLAKVLMNYVVVEVA